MRAAFAKLAQSGAGTVQEAQHAGTSAQTRSADLQRETVAVGLAQTQVAVLDAQLIKARAQRALAQAALLPSRMKLG